MTEPADRETRNRRTPCPALMLGTVQWGMRYGVANRSGQPDYPGVRAMVEAAVAGGVTGFDTAAAYGESERMLGRALRDLGVADRVQVVTKVRALTPEERASAARAQEAIEHSVGESRQRLGLERIPVVLFHREEDAVHLEVLDRLKSRGWLAQAGVSCGHDPESAKAWAGRGGVGALQLPANLLDRRHARGGAFDAAAAAAVDVYVRSVFLQGLLLMPEGDIPAELRDVIPVRRRLAVLAGEGGLTPAGLAVRALLAQPGATALLLGVETAEQVRENLSLFRQGPLDAGLLRRVEEAVPALPPLLITPALWGRG